MPDRPTPLPPPNDNKYARGPVSGALTEPEQPLVVLGDGGTEVDDTMVLRFVTVAPGDTGAGGVRVFNDGGNQATVEITFPEGRVDVEVQSLWGQPKIDNCVFLHFYDAINLDNFGNGGAYIRILPAFTNDGHQHLLLQQGAGLNWMSLPGNGTFVLGCVNNAIQWLQTTSC